MKSLDEIMSADGEAAPEVEAPAIETSQAPEAHQEPPQPEDDGQESEQSGMVPVGALHAERAKSRKYTEELAETRKAIDELRAAMAQQRPAAPQAPVAPQPPKEAPSLWEDPDAYVEHRLRQALEPVQQAMLANARLAAESIHKPETVEQAVTAFVAARDAGRIDPSIVTQVENAPNPFHMAVQWQQHVKRQEALSKYGDDPEAAFEAEVQRRLAAASGAQPSAGQAPTPMPSSFSAGRSAGPRTAPVYSGPKPLSEIMNGR